jgi:hypothetical protein
VDLVERAGHLKPMLVDFALSPRFGDELAAVIARSFPDGVASGEPEFSMALDHFALQHRLPSGRTDGPALQPPIQRIPGTSLMR